MTETVLSLDLQGWVNLYKSSRDVGRVGLQMPTHIKVTSTRSISVSLLVWVKMVPLDETGRGSTGPCRITF